MFVDVNIRQLTKTNEELCGDTIYVSRDSDGILVVLADGLGSGVKANILSTLTAKIAMTLLQNGLPLSEVVQTLTATLPVCKVRSLAYSTFTVLRIRNDGQTSVVDFDNPELFVFHQGEPFKPSWEYIQEHNFKLRRANFKLIENDYVVMASDGLTHAGLGGLKPLGWRWDGICDYLKRFLWLKPESEELATQLIEVANSLYENKVGDDTSVAAIRCRPIRNLVMAVGPPVKPEDDSKMVNEFVSLPGKKIVCGGTTAKIIARETGVKLKVNLNSDWKSIPPAGNMDGVDLVTEGVITLTKTVELLDRPSDRMHPHRLQDMQEIYATPGVTAAERTPQVGEKPAPTNPAEELTNYLQWADQITILMGRAINPAHQNPELPVSLGLKLQMVEQLATKLRVKNKTVSVRKF